MIVEDSGGYPPRLKYYRSETYTMRGGYLMVLVLFQNFIILWLLCDLNVIKNTCQCKFQGRKNSKWHGIKRIKIDWANGTNNNNGRSHGNILQMRAKPSLLELCRAQLDIHGIKEMQKLKKLA